jgi:hypothetical protein
MKDQIKIFKVNYLSNELLNFMEDDRRTLIGICISATNCPVCFKF